MAHTLPNLPYDYTALEPYIDAQTMEIHHGRHHKAYVDNLNKAIEGTEAEKLSLEDLMKNITNYPAAVRNNGGGHYNHSLFWTVLGNNGSQPSGKLADAIEAFGGLETLKEKVNAAGAARFGSGWAWICVNNGKIEVCSTPNQDNPLMPDTGCNGTPIFGVDVWEHAYYLKYQNKRPDYLNAIWNVVNWDEVGKRFEAAL